MVDGTTILLVEDNPLMRETLCDILEVFHPEWRVMANEFSVARFTAFGEAARARAARKAVRHRG